ncbi:MAG: nucleotidyltransferase family protein [Hyphomicrobiaceae bacterium]
MTPKHTLIQDLLLDLLATSRAPPADIMGRMDEAAWMCLNRMSREHRLEAQLHWRYMQNGSSWTVPAIVRAEWAEAFRASAFRSLALQRAMLAIHKLLHDAGIPHAFLKGAFLAWNAYAHPALRPMRDLDVIVGAADARVAHAVLVHGGFSQRRNSVTSIDDAVESGKHLPTLVSPVERIDVELHVRLAKPEVTDMGVRLADADTLIARRIEEPFAGLAVPFLSPTDTLLHLIVHAVYEHQFDNGPLTLSDIAACIGTGKIDWTALARAVEVGGWQRACRLAIGLAEHYHGPLRGQDEPLVPGEVLQHASRLMLRDTGNRSAVLMLARLDGSGTRARRLRVVWSKLFPPRSVIASHAGIEPDGRGVWLHYPSWLFDGLRRLAASSHDTRHRTEVRALQAVRSWLSESEGAQARQPDFISDRLH